MLDLTFPTERSRIEEIPVSCADRSARVTCRVWRYVPYVSFPVDPDYQSLDLYEPIAIDGAAVDCRRAPIFFSIRVFGYMSVRNNVSGDAPPVQPPPPPPPHGLHEPASPTADLSPTDQQALANGFVVVIPGCRGRECVDADGKYIGKAPASIVDLKAAVRYLRSNAHSIPGDTEHIVSYGLSAGGALSALLGASGDSADFAPYLSQLGAAESSDRVFAAACFCPITDLAHQDMAHEWMRGRQPMPDGTLVNQTLSRELTQANAAYQRSLALTGRDDFGLITEENYGRYITDQFLVPAAQEFLCALSPDARKTYLADRPWLHWDGAYVQFSFEDFCNYSGRMKGLPACDSFDLSSAENGLFGDEAADRVHFTLFSLRHTTGDPTAVLSPSLDARVRLMDPMRALRAGCPGAAHHWWLRCGSLERGASLSVLTNLATLAENLGMDVNYRYYWDRGHAVDDDPAELFAWMHRLSGSDAQRA